MAKIQRSDRPAGQATQQFTPPQAAQSIPAQHSVQATRSIPAQRSAQATQSIPAQHTAQATRSIPAQRPAQATQSIPTQHTAQATRSIPAQRPAQATRSIPAQHSTQATQSIPTQHTAQAAQSAPTQQPSVHATQTIRIRRSDLNRAASASQPKEEPSAQKKAASAAPAAAAAYNWENDADFTPPETETPHKEKTARTYKAPKGGADGKGKKDKKDKKDKTDKKKSRRNLLYNLAMLAFGAVFVVCAGLLGKRYWDDHQAQQEFGSLQSLIDTTADTTGTEETASGNSAKFAALRAQNDDCIGWISIEDTPLDLPVMYKPDSVNYYLRRGFDEQYSVYGVPYIDEKCTLGANRQSENLIVYGHHMKTGTIFGSLQGYKKADYYTEHPYVELDTIYGDAKYEVFGAFAIDVVDDQSFLYNQYTDMDEDTYNEYVQQVLSRSDVDTGIVPTYSEQLLTLSTCDYSSENGRYVVVARRVSE